LASKYNISSKVNSKLKTIEEEKKDEIEKLTTDQSSKNETSQPKTFLATTSDNNEEELKNKSVEEVIEDLKNIENSYKNNNYIDAPDELELSYVEVPNKSEDELIKVAKDSLEHKYNSQKENTTKNFEKEIDNLLASRETYQKNADEQSRKISEIYNENVKETEEQALKRGLARSSIIINQISEINADKANQLVNVLNTLQDNINSNQSKIDELNYEKNLALTNLDIEYAIELEEKIQKTLEDYNKARQDAIDFNNSVSKLQAEYKLDLDKQKLDKQETLTKLESEYGVNYTKNKIKTDQYNFLKKYFDSLDKDYALSLFLTNKEFKNILQTKYTDMYEYLKSR